MTSRRLEDRVCIVTGGAGGIGRASALRFAQEGARVLVADLSREGGEATAEAIRRAGGRAAFAETDVTQPESVEAMVDLAIERFGRLDCLFNVVGVSGRSLGDGPAAECRLEAWDHVLSVNLRSVFLCCRAAIPRMAAAGGGSIINLASVLGLVGAQDHFGTHAYAASKGGVIALTRAIALYYARDRIRANVIAPGLIETPMSRRAQADPAILEAVARHQPLTGTLGKPEDVAAAAAYLASDDAAFVTGVVLPVDGGWTAQ